MKPIHHISFFRNLSLVLLLSTIGIFKAFAVTPVREYYELRIYTLSNKIQQGRVEKYLQEALIPALHKARINKTVVLKTPEGDTTGLKIYVLIPFTSMDQLLLLPQQLRKDKQYEAAGVDYLTATYENPPYSRFETVIMKAFANMPNIIAPKLNTPKSERVYELRSYESATERMHLNKLKMFNEGGEIEIFKQIEANPVFFGQVISGSHMPNLMYLTAYANKAAREEHWNVFRNRPEWKKLSSMPEYLKNVSHSDILLLQPTDYSDL